MSRDGIHLSHPPRHRFQSDPADTDRLAAALAAPADERRTAVAAVVAASPRFLDGWAVLGDLGRDPIERYAAYRSGHRHNAELVRTLLTRGEIRTETRRTA